MDSNPPHSRLIRLTGAHRPREATPSIGDVRGAEDPGHHNLWGAVAIQPLHVGITGMTGRSRACRAERHRKTRADTRARRHGGRSTAAWKKLDVPCDPGAPGPRAAPRRRRHGTRPPDRGPPVHDGTPDTPGRRHGRDARARPGYGADGRAPPYGDPVSAARTTRAAPGQTRDALSAGTSVDGRLRRDRERWHPAVKTNSSAAFPPAGRRASVTPKHMIKSGNRDFFTRTCVWRNLSKATTVVPEGDHREGPT